MLLLVTDTSGKHGSVALVRADTGDEIAVIEEVALVGGTFSAQLIPQIASLLANHSFSKTDIGAFIVVSGPGSFTGLRVGLAAIKALAEILKKPIVPVSLLEVVALAARVERPHAQGQRKVLAALDAGRGEIYAGEYEISARSSRLLREELLTREQFLSRARDLQIITPDDTLAATAKNTGLSVVKIGCPGAAPIAQLGWSKLQAGQIVAPAQLDANYIRRSDAEIFAKPVSNP